MLIIRYCEEGIPVNDFKASEFWDKILEDYKDKKESIYEVEVSTLYTFDMGIIRAKVDLYEESTFIAYIQDEQIDVDEYFNELIPGNSFEDFEEIVDGINSLSDEDWDEVIKMLAEEDDEMDD